MKNKKCDKCENLNLSSAKYCSQCGYKLAVEEVVENTPQINQKLKSKNRLVPIIVGIITFIVAYFGAQKLFNTEQTFDKVLTRVASEINENCPLIIDGDTRLDNTIGLPNNTFQYNYTLINLDQRDINVAELRKTIEPNIVNNVKTNPDMKEFRDNKVTMTYNYKDKNGVFIIKIIVTPEMYE
ncbi:MAG: hypothetical protein COA50_05990 [Flavobacteriaceae bacterium]|nr:MAG: hypothetical protein COA50_05990 [Flavobacteriaceae bacterium]